MACRYLHFGIQLFETGAIQDYLVANQYWEQVRVMTSVDWEDYESCFRPTYLDVRTHLEAPLLGCQCLRASNMCPYKS